MPKVIRDANGTHRDGLRSDERVHPPDLLARLFEVTPHREGLPCCGLKASAIMSVSLSIPESRDG